MFIKFFIKIVEYNKKWIWDGLWVFLNWLSLRKYKIMSPSFVAFVVIVTTLGVLIGIFIDISKK